ncbi:MAG: nucleotide exchange factor GrpE [Oscillospiraceae bacterium]
MAKQKETPEMQETGVPVPPVETTPPQEEMPAEKTSKQAKKEEKTLSGLEAKLAAAEQKAADAEKKLAETSDLLLRTAAEYDNYRKRSQKEQEGAFGNGLGHAACQLLPVLDTLEAAAQTETTDEEYKKGVLLTLAKCGEIFEKLGIHEIEALGKPFDPELHNAVMQEEAEGAESGSVTRVMQKGYTLNGKVVRHSMVAVAP